MLAALADHLWQSLLFCGLCAALSWIARCNSARVRLWVWRLCALKLVIPFSLLFGVGRWMGFPAYHSADRVPAPLVRAADALVPLFAPAKSAGVASWAAALCVLVLLAAIAMFVPRLLRSLLFERARAGEEAARRQADVDSSPPELGFFKAALFTACAALIFSGTVMAGAIADRRWRQELLLTHARALRDAPIHMAQAAPGMGLRWRIDVSANGILLRNICVQDLVALAYGVNHYAVWGNQMMYEEDPTSRPWLVDPRYDLRIEAHIVEAGDFDAYALRPRLTQYLAERFGYEIYINGRCQPPCGKYGVAMPDLEVP
ncbi:MAG TPA: hypothetical protein VFZ95_04010 [Steroidobacteraceae bacterium]